MNTRDLQSMIEARDDALLIDMDRKAELAERTADEAERIADAIVRDFTRLHGFLARGDLVLHETPCIGPDKSDSTIEREIVRIISQSADNPESPMHWIAEMVRDTLTENVDVLQAANAAAYGDMIDHDAWRETDGY